MKPNFALKLSNDGIELLHRDPGGWLSLGAVSFETDDVQAGCERLLAEARRLAPEGIRTKLVIPDSQLRYASISAPGPTDEARRYQIEAEIEAMSPYSIDELTYDWSIEDDTALVVICARDTLAEAEGFAEASGFNPVAFVAIPEGGEFVGEPNFGLTSVAKAYIPSGEKLQFDAEPVRVIGKARRAPAASEAPARPEEPGKPEEPAKPEERAKADTRAAPAAPTIPAARSAEEPRAATAAPVTPPVRAGADTRPVAARPAPALSARPAGETPDAAGPARMPSSATPSVVAEPVSKVGNLVRRMGTRLRREQATEAAKPVVPPARPAQPEAKAEATDPAKAAPVVADMRVPPSVSGPSKADTPAAASGKAPAPRPAPGTDAARAGGAAASPAAAVTPPTPRPAPGATDAPKDVAVPVAFASRRRPAPVVAASGSGPASSDPQPGGRIAVLPGDAKKSGPTLINRVKRQIKRARRAVLSRIPSAEAKPAAAPRRAAERQRAALPEPIVPTSRPPASERDKATEAEALTIFGARGQNNAQPGLARRGLMAAGGVSLLLVAVAVWFLYFNQSETPQQIAMTGSDSSATMPSIAAPDRIDAPAQDAGITAPASLAALPDNSGVGQTVDAARDAAGADATPDLAASTTDTDAIGDAVGQAVTDALDATDPDRLLESLVQETVADSTTAVTGQTTDQAATAQAQPESTAPQGQPTTPEQATDTPQVASTVAAQVQRLSLPAGLEVPEVSEVAFEAPPPPPPFGTEFTFNENGLVLATPEGALTPSGVTVFARRPAVAPAPRPAGIAPEGAVQPAAPEPAPTVAETADTAAPEAVAPEAVAPEAPAEVVFDDTPRADPALAGARPQPRSERVRAIGEQLAPATPEPEPDAATGQQDAAAEDLTETDTAALETPPPGGVSLDALRPQTRPTDLVPPEVAAAAAVETPAVDDTGATPEAVAASLRPSRRPSDITERARAILAAAASSAPAQPAAAAAAAPAGDTDLEDDEGETASAAAQPSIPSSASVARAATETDAINLRDVNLIGVFGTASDRRALVRLSSGRVVRVRVGDRLDGGQVTAIGENELRYTRNGRNEVLEIGG